MVLSDPWGITLLVGFFGLFGLMVSWMINQERRSSNKHSKQAAAFGFQPVNNPSPALVKQILALHTCKSGQQLEVRNIYHKRTLEANLYLFDLWDPSGSHAVLMAESAVAVFLMPAVIIPRLSLIPRTETGEPGYTFSGTWSLSQLVTGLQMLAFSDCPEFNRRFFAAGLEESAARAFLTPDLRRQLARIGRFHIEAASSVITLSEMEPRICGEAERLERIKNQITTGVTLARWLSVAGH